MSGSEDAKKKRNKATFTTDHLLVETLSKNPYSAAKPADVWRAVAKTLDETKKFAAPVSSRFCQERVGVLLDLHHKEDTASLKRSGTEEEFTEFQRILGDLDELRVLAAQKTQEAKAAKAQKKDEDDRVGAEISAAGEITFTRSVAGNSMGDEWEDTSVQSESEQPQEGTVAGVENRKHKRHSIGGKGGSGERDLTEGDLASVFAKQDQPKFEHRKMALLQHKNLKEKELLQERELREKEIRAREKETESRNFSATLQHKIRLKELALEQERIEIRKRELALLENR